MLSIILKLRNVNKLYPYIENTRITNWRGYLGIGLLGFIHAACIQYINITDLALKLVIYIISLSFYLGFAFSINNCFDALSDSINPIKKGKNPIARGELNFKKAYIVSILLSLLGIVWNIIFIGNLGALAIYLSLITLAYFYSAPPLRLKSKPPFDLISHGLFFGVLIYYYGLVFHYVRGLYDIKLMVMLMSIFTYSTLLNLRNHIEDYEGDSKAGIKTTAVYLGLARSLRLLSILIHLHMMLLALVINVVLEYTLIFILYPLFFVLSFTISVNIDERLKYLRVLDTITLIVYILYTIYTIRVLL